MSALVRPLRRGDWPAVAAIYADGIATGDATFEIAVPAWAAWDASHLPAPRLAAEVAGLWTLQPGIFPENAASLTLHQRAGFRLVGRRERLGQLRGRWRDVLLLERRA